MCHVPPFALILLSWSFPRFSCDDDNRNDMNHFSNDNQKLLTGTCFVATSYSLELCMNILHEWKRLQWRSKFWLQLKQIIFWARIRFGQVLFHCNNCSLIILVVCLKVELCNCECNWHVFIRVQTADQSTFCQVLHWKLWFMQRKSREEKITFIVCYL